jgi:hypothetical protein
MFFQDLRNFCQGRIIWPYFGWIISCEIYLLRSWSSSCSHDFSLGLVVYSSDLLSRYILPLLLLRNTAVTAYVGPVPGTLEGVPRLLVLAPASISIGTTSPGTSGRNLDVDSSKGLMDGFLKCSSKMPGGIDSMDDPTWIECWLHHSELGEHAKTHNLQSSH